jgi:hypothetical protein
MQCPLSSQELCVLLVGLSLIDKTGDRAAKGGRETPGFFLW